MKSESTLPEIRKSCLQIKETFLSKIFELKLHHIRFLLRIMKILLTKYALDQSIGRLPYTNVVLINNVLNSLPMHTLPGLVKMTHARPSIPPIIFCGINTLTMLKVFHLLGCRHYSQIYCGVLIYLILSSLNLHSKLNMLLLILINNNTNFLALLSMINMIDVNLETLELVGTLVGIRNFLSTP